MKESPVLMDVNDVAKALRVSPHTVRRWASQKKLHKLKLGSRTLFDPSDVDRFVEEARQAATESGLCREDDRHATR